MSVHDRLRRFLDDKMRRLILVDDGCWNWYGPINKDGYGHLGTTGFRALAHRAAYARWVGPIPDGLLVCHHCDNRRCCNPAHLFVGTHHDNTQDMMRKGRQVSGYVPGEKSGSAKLTNEQVLEIRRTYGPGVTQDMLAAKFGVTRHHISSILSRTTWKHI